MTAKTDFEKLAERVDRALDELREGSPTDALRTLETARAEALHAKKVNDLVKHLEFWK